MPFAVLAICGPCPLKIFDNALGSALGEIASTDNASRLTFQWKRVYREWDRCLCWHVRHFWHPPLAPVISRLHCWCLCATDTYIEVYLSIWQRDFGTASLSITLSHKQSFLDKPGIQRTRKCESQQSARCLVNVST